MVSLHSSEAWNDEKENKLTELRDKYLPSLEDLLSPYGDIPVEQMLGPEQKARPEFSDHGFEAHTLFYRKPEKYWNEVGLLVPRDLDLTRIVKVHVFFMGGGFWTGDWKFCYWYLMASLQLAKEENAIILSVNYPRFPIASEKHITCAVDAFWNYFYSTELDDDCNAKKPGLVIDRARLIISGESAGAYVALYSVVFPHNKLDYRVLFLRYGMLGHYLRTDHDQLVLQYMGVEKNKVEAQKYAQDTWELAQEIRKAMENAGLLSSDDPSIFADILNRRTPPYGMAGAFISSWIGTWSNFFGLTPKGEIYPDMLARMSDKAENDKLEPSKAPKLVMYHGIEDTNVSIEQSETLVKFWRKRYGLKDTTDRIIFIRVEGQKHGFDYTILGKEFLAGRDKNGKIRGGETMEEVMAHLRKDW